MTSRKPPNWEKTGTIAGYAQWLRQRSGALCVLVIRRDDAVLASDDALPAQDVRTVVENHLDGLIEGLKAARAEKRGATRSCLDELSE